MKGKPLKTDRCSSNRVTNSPQFVWDFASFSTNSSVPQEISQDSCPPPQTDQEKEQKKGWLPHQPSEGRLKLMYLIVASILSPLTVLASSFLFVNLFGFYSSFLFYLIFKYETQHGYKSPNYTEGQVQRTDTALIPSLPTLPPTAHSTLPHPPMLGNQFHQFLVSFWGSFCTDDYIHIYFISPLTN